VVFERTGHPASYPEAKKIKSLALHTHGWPKVRIFLFCQQIETNKTVLLLEKDLRTHLEALSKEKNEKMEQLDALVKADEQLSRILGVPVHEIDKDRVPTEEQVAELEERIAGLNAEKVSCDCNMMEIIIILISLRCT